MFALRPCIDTSKYFSSQLLFSLPPQFLFLNKHTICSNCIRTLPQNNIISRSYWGDDDYRNRYIPVPKKKPKKESEEEQRQKTIPLDPSQPTSYTQIPLPRRTVPRAIRRELLQPEPVVEGTNTQENLRVTQIKSPDIYPVVALVGRPNVGKSTLFNRFALGDKRALVSDMEGTTRDRDYASCRWYGRELIVVDTGGIIGEGNVRKDSLSAQVREQALIAIEEASTIVFVLDLHEGVTPHDVIIARLLRTRASTKNIILVVNKADNFEDREEIFPEKLVEFERLGFGDPFLTSAIHGEGFIDIMRKVVEPYDETPEEDNQSKEIRIAIVGQPNAGKSSLLNRITGQERAVVSPIAGTTVDPVDTLITWRDTYRVRLIDTAGIWKKAKDHLARAAVIWALRVVQRAHVVVLVMDGTVGVTEHDMHVAGFILEHMKSVVVAVNKWDIIPKVLREREEYKPKREKKTHYQWMLQAQEIEIANGLLPPKEPQKERVGEDDFKEEDDAEDVEEEVDEEAPKEAYKKVFEGDALEMAYRKIRDKMFQEEKAEEERWEKVLKKKEIRAKHLKERKRKEMMGELEQRKTSKSIENEYEAAARSQLRFMPFVPFMFISATTGYRVPSLMDRAVEAYHEREKRIKTQDMFEILRTAAVRHKMPGKGKNMLKIRFATQIEAFPPTFVFFVNNPDAVPPNYEKFLESCIREKYPFSGTPIRLLFKKNANKYTDEKKSSDK